ncbi:MAG: DUF4375 domain-containing protein [Clostridia bacterium]|nr:DUF4375 domain-containing protein [Clostridia bacterium]
MGLFDILRKKKTELTDEQLRWNKMWDLWTEGETQSPYTELMTYQSEINNGGHDQYFLNIGNTGDLQKEMSALGQLLSSELKENLRKAYEAYIALEENEEDEKAAEILEKCDNAFYENEEEINNILEEYSLNFSV